MKNLTQVGKIITTAVKTLPMPARSEELGGMVSASSLRGEKLGNRKKRLGGEECAGE